MKMKAYCIMKMKAYLFTSLLLPTSLAMLLAASAAAQETAPAGNAATGAKKPEAKATADNAAPVKVGVQELLKNKEKLDGKKVQLEGMVTEICTKKGCWAMLHDLDSDAKGLVRVKEDDNQSNFKAFLPEHQGRTVVVTGELHVTKIDTAYLDKWEARVKAPKMESKEGEDADQAPKAVLKQIAALREKLAKSGKPYLSSMQVAVDKWEVKPEAKTDAKATRS